MNAREIHEAAWAAARAVMQRIEAVFMDAELHDAFIEVYEAIRTSLQAAVERQEREQQQLHPLEGRG